MMKGPRIIVHVAVGAALGLVGPVPALALPTMIRLGYPNCVACHISPQGAGLLNDYGRGIDQAQSLRAGEYRTSENQMIKALNWGGRITQDIRAVLRTQTMWAADTPAGNTFRPLLMYRNVTELGGGFRLSATATSEGESAPRPSLHYEPATSPSTTFVNTALVHYRAATTVEFAAGRDQLPTGLNVPDATAYVKSRNRLGYYDAPTQFKMAWWGKRYHLSPFVYAPGGNEPSGEHEAGGGSLAEFDVLGNQRTVAGAAFLRGSADNGNRQILGAYARLGFGRWGVLAEHDVTHRTRNGPTQVSFRQDASYAQVFCAVREWLVASAIGERLRVEPPFDQHLVAGGLQLVARLASQATISFGARVERNILSGRLSRSVAVQAAFKTVN